jgi:hypothetical protein
MREPLAVFLLPIGLSSKKLRVVIWEYLKDLRGAAKETSGDSASYWRRAAGAYIATRGPRRFGEIHLWNKIIGAGYFAHELQHFMIDYIEWTESFPLNMESNERAALLAEDLTAVFWTRYYKRFPEKEPG